MTTKSELIKMSLSTSGCERISDFYKVGPVQKAAVETFFDAILEHRDTLDENDNLVTELANLRDIFPIPDRGTKLEILWAEAMSFPESVPAYVRACIESKNDGEMK